MEENEWTRQVLASARAAVAVAREIRADAAHLLEESRRRRDRTNDLGRPLPGEASDRAGPPASGAALSR